MRRDDDDEDDDVDDDCDEDYDDDDGLRGSFRRDWFRVENSWTTLEPRPDSGLPRVCLTQFPPSSTTDARASVGIPKTKRGLFLRGRGLHNDPRT